MTDILKYDMTNIWASAGDVVAPDAAKINAGWGVEVVPRQWWNWFENRQDQNIAYILQKGLPEWDATTEYIINKSYVNRNGIVYRATATNTNSDPIALTSWVRAFADYSVASNALGSLTPAANTLPYFDSSSTATLTTLTAFARTLLDDVDADAVRGTISAQQSNTNLTALSGVTAVANGLPYFTGTTSMGIATLTSFGRSFISALDNVAARTVLGLGTSATVDIITNALDFTVGRILTTGAYGLGRGVDVRSSGVSSGTPSSLYMAGTVFGYANGGTGAPGGLSIPGLGATNIGVLTLNAHGASFTGMNRRFLSGVTGEEYVQVATSATTWGTWYKSLSTVTATDFGQTLLTFADALAVRVGIGADNASNLTQGTIPAARVPTLNQNTTGNAATATALQTPRAINGVNFDGTAAITIVDATKEPAITAGPVTSYIAANKTTRPFATDVLNVTLSTLSSPVASAVLSTDLLITGIGKLQSQANTFAKKGANSDITSIAGLTTALTVAQGGTGGTTQATAARSLALMPAGNTLSTSDLNTMFTDGHFFLTGSPANSPAGAGWLTVMGVDGAGGSTYCSQSFVSATNNGTKYDRVRINSVWQNWVQDQVYAFSQLTGQPTDNANLATALSGKLSITATGGTNLNGWIKYSDNTTEQWGTVSVVQSAEGTLFSFNTPFTSVVKVFQCTSNQYPRGSTGEANNAARAENLTQFRVMSGHAASPAPFTWYARGV